MEKIKELSYLLQRIAKAMQLEQQYMGNTNGNFNIFRVLGVEEKEVIICRFLGELLDPNGSHQMGHMPLLRFVKQVLREDSFNEADAKNAYVRLEEKTDNARRVDITIHSGKVVFPIEVKIWAGDQDAQLADYYTNYRRQYLLERIYYLTPTGWEPSEQSRRRLKVGQHISCISFREEIKTWLQGLLPDCKQIRVCNSIQQFVEVIEKMVADNKQIKLMNDVLNLNDQEDMDLKQINAALLLLKHKDQIQKAIWKKFLKKNLECGDGYVIVECEEADLDVDKYTLLRINKNDRTVAWICVQKNLYLYCKKTNPSVTHAWHGDENGEYRWIHLSPNGRKTYPLRDMSELKNEIINISDILGDIDTNI